MGPSEASISWSLLDYLDGRGQVFELQVVAAGELKRPLGHGMAGDHWLTVAIGPHLARAASSKT